MYRCVRDVTRARYFLFECRAFSSRAHLRHLGLFVTQTIEQGTWKRFDASYNEEDIETGGMGPCLGILIHEPVSMVVFGGHFEGETHVHTPGDVHEMLDTAFREFALASDVRVYVSGCCFAGTTPGERKTANDLRYFVAQELGSRCSPNIKVNWLWPTVQSWVDMNLNGTTRKLDIIS